MSDSRDSNNSTLGGGTFADEEEVLGSAVWTLGVGARETGQEVGARVVKLPIMGALVALTARIAPWYSWKRLGE